MLFENESQEYEIRVEKVKKLRALSIEPWPEFEPIDSNASRIKADYEQDQQEREYKVAGRLMTIRLHGKSIFADVQDESGRIQIYLKKDMVGDQQFDIFKDLIDIGDIVWVKGTSFKTKMNETTLHVAEFKLLSKCLRPLPEKFHGLTDIETKYRQRYLDLISSAETKERFVKRSAILKSIRNYLDSHGYIEVETPMLHPIAGGAAAKPFTTHHNALSSDFYLRIAPELYLKRLVVGGFERVYEINRNFRNEGVSTRHNPEFTMIEFYTANEDYHFSMNMVEKLIRKAADEVMGSQLLPFGDHVIDFEKPFTRISVKDAVKLHANLTDADLDQSKIDESIKKLGIKISRPLSLSEKIYLIFDEIVESKLVQPTFVIDFPIEVSPLSKRDADNPEIAARYELFVAGMEIANSFNELNDPFDQAQRFKDQLKAFESGDQEAHQYDADYVLALEYGLPPTVGVGIGIDRLIMLLTNTTSIKEVILFPTLKKKI